jgi:hypothetical protein
VRANLGANLLREDVFRAVFVERSGEVGKLAVDAIQ